MSVPTSGQRRTRSRTSNSSGTATSSKVSTSVPQQSQQQHRISASPSPSQPWQGDNISVPTSRSSTSSVLPQRPASQRRLQQQLHQRGILGGGVGVGGGGGGSPPHPLLARKNSPIPDQRPPRSRSPVPSHPPQQRPRSRSPPIPEQRARSRSPNPGTGTTTMQSKTRSKSPNPMPSQESRTRSKSQLAIVPTPPRRKLSPQPSAPSLPQPVRRKASAPPSTETRTRSKSPTPNPMPTTDQKHRWSISSPFKRKSSSSPPQGKPNRSSPPIRTNSVSNNTNSHSQLMTQRRSKQRLSTASSTNNYTPTSHLLSQQPQQRSMSRSSSPPAPLNRRVSPRPQSERILQQSQGQGSRRRHHQLPRERSSGHDQPLSYRDDGAAPAQSPKRRGSGSAAILGAAPDKEDIKPAKLPKRRGSGGAAVAAAPDYDHNTKRRGGGVLRNENPTPDSERTVKRRNSGPANAAAAPESDRTVRRRGSGKRPVSDRNLYNGHSQPGSRLLGTTSTASSHTTVPTSNKKPNVSEVHIRRGSSSTRDSNAFSKKGKSRNFASYFTKRKFSLPPEKNLGENKHSEKKPVEKKTTEKTSSSSQPKTKPRRDKKRLSGPFQFYHAYAMPTWSSHSTASTAQRRDGSPNSNGNTPTLSPGTRPTRKSSSRYSTTVSSSQNPRDRSPTKYTRSKPSKRGLLRAN